MNKKLLLLPLLCITTLASFSQKAFNLCDTSKRSFSDNFYLWYDVAGLGSNLGNFYPVIKIKNGVLLYTEEQNSYYVEKDSTIDTICLVKIRQSSIDSIKELVRGLKDTSIYAANTCVMSGVIHFMTIASGRDTTKFELDNTFDYTALKVVAILNTYLPADKRLWANEQMIKDAEECRVWRKKRLTKER